MARITLEGYRCERCDHKWVPRDNNVPRVCPKCKSPYWDIPRGTRGKDLRRINSPRGFSKRTKAYVK